MNTFFDNFHFLRPMWLLALLALPLLWQALRRYGSDAQVWRDVVDAHLLEHLLIRGHTPTWRVPLVLITAGWALACFALAGPAWERLPQPLYQNRAARVIALELASSMQAQDVKPSRVERARFKISDILKRSTDGQSALIAYAGDAFVVAPLTDDANTVANLLDALTPDVMPVAGNDTARAINLGVKLIHQAGLTDGELILIADAVSTNALAAARSALASGVRVSVLGIGSTQGAPVALPQGGFLKDATGNIVLPKLDVAALSAVAQAGGGRYAMYSADATDLDALLDTLRPHDASESLLTQAQSPRFLDRGPWLLLVLLPLVALGFRRGWLFLLPLLVVGHSTPGYAFSWADLWQRPDQQAQARLDAGDAKGAQLLAHDPDLRGTAAYRAGDYAAATQDFGSRKYADPQYNLGNALAKQGRYQEALTAYTAALKQAPGMEDAIANKRAIEDWLKQQQDKKDKNNNNNKSQSNNDSKDHQGHDQSQQDQSQKNSAQQAGQQDQHDQDSAQNSSANASDKEQKDQGKQQQSSTTDNQNQSDSNANEQQKTAPQSTQQDQDAKSQGATSSNADEADKQAQQQFQQTLDQALKQDDSKKRDQPQTVRLGARESATPSEQQQALEQWLQRVPDDPGGLLRRKFELEYERRQNGGGAPGNEP